MEAASPFDLNLERHQLVSTSCEFVRDLWFLPSPTNEASALGVFLDGEHYLRDLDCVPIITGLMEDERIPPMSCLFISHCSSAARHADFTCNPRYAQFVACDVVAWARAKIGIREDGHLLCGLSLSGLASAYTTLCHPEVFSKSLSQSGSFWWSEDRSLEMPRTGGQFWLSVGDQETARNVTHPPTGMVQITSQLGGVRAMARRLEKLGAVVKVHEYSGGHAVAPWRAELADALQWLMSGKAAERMTEKSR